MLRRFTSRKAEPERAAKRDLRIVAIISVFEDELYLQRCFDNIADQGVDVIVIDNDANEATKAIVKADTRSVVREVVHLPRHGCFDWTGLLKCKQQICNSHDGDWFLLWDSDEIREPPSGYASLREAITAVDSDGYNTIYFDEFVFMPTDREQNFAGTDYVSQLDSYYFFQPHPRQRMNGWKKPPGRVDLIKGAGHVVKFARQRVFPQPFIMRHYLFLSYTHGLAKYGGRRYADRDMKKGWSRERAQTSTADFCLPARQRLKIKQDGTNWDRSEPFKKHPCFNYL